MKMIRTCIICKVKTSQKELIRLQILQNELQKYSGTGRSFYVCGACVALPKTLDIISKRYKVNNVREILL